MKTTSLLLLLLAGCSSYSPIGNLEDQYIQCTSLGSQGCDRIAEEMDQYYERLSTREKREKARCSKSTVKCMTPEEFEDFVAQVKYW